MDEWMDGWMFVPLEHLLQCANAVHRIHLLTKFQQHRSVGSFG